MITEYKMFNRNPEGKSHSEGHGIDWIIILKCKKVKVSRYTPLRRMGGEEV
jgi:hypothetical protein